MSFNKNFMWGAATASYQIEGAAFTDGRGLSVWDNACGKSNFVRDNHNGNEACDHYHRFKEDIALMKEIGLKYYRMSISWSRILPNGIGKPNKKGLDFYDALINELLANEITPLVTLFHWDYPMELYKMGGWLNPASSDWFYEYAKIVVKHFSDRVKNWIPINEHQCFIHLGHFTGTHAPGVQLSFKEALFAGHHSLIAHGKGVLAIRECSKQPAIIGSAHVGIMSIPNTEDIKDIAAARNATFAIEPNNLWNSSWWMDPMFLGRYPEEGLSKYKEFLPEITEEDMKIIHQPLDFFGVNIYNGATVKADPNGKPELVVGEWGYPRTAFNWTVTPDVLYYGAKFYHERYGKPIIITENGMANCDWVALDGKVHDPQRIDFLERYLKALKKAADEGIPIDGYFIWTLIDNFEWAEGYHQRFGLIHTDFQTQKRTIKDSAYWYKRVMETNGDLL